MQRVTNHHWEIVQFGAGAMALFTVASIGLSQLGFRFNSTPSLPVGIWKVDTMTGALKRGQIVSLQPPNAVIFQTAKSRGYLGWGPGAGGYASLLKPVAAIGGDRVLVSVKGIAVNGALLRNSKALIKDTLGRPLTPAEHGIYTVRPGTVWVVSNCVRSFDSRYFGPVPTANILGTARPVCVGGFIK